MCIYAYINIYINVYNNNKKEVINLKGLKVKYLGGFEERKTKGGDDVVIVII